MEKAERILIISDVFCYIYKANKINVNNSF